MSLADISVKSRLSFDEFAERLKFMADNFNRLADDKRNRVDMREIYLVHKPNCETLACHAGWASTFIPVSDINVEDARRLASNQFFLGLVAIAEFFQLEGGGGFGSHSHSLFAHWAEVNPKTWGNPYGGIMFSVSGYLAFDLPAYSNVTLRDIARKYEMVRLSILDQQSIYDPKPDR